MKNIKCLKNKKIWCFLIIIIFFIMVIANIIIEKDGMEQSGLLNVKYRTFNSKGWSKWSKNGITSGNFKDDIKNIEVKIDDKVSGTLTYQTFNKKNNWLNGITIDETKQNQTFSGIKMSSTGNIYKRYNICYRTYNKKNKWMDWSCDAIINGNATENIKAIEIKIVPKNVILREYLKDYNKTGTNKNLNFE